MNIFALDNSPTRAAQYHNSPHVVKMVLETAQLLCTAHHLHAVRLSPLLYKPTHVNHPCAVWVRDNAVNYDWTVRLLQALLQEYTYRYGRQHKVETDGLYQYLYSHTPKLRRALKRTQFATAIPDDCIVPGDPVASYRKYYTTHKQHLAWWSGKVNDRTVPTWYENQGG